MRISLRVGARVGFGVAVLLLFLIGTGAPLLGQSNRGSLAGTIMDSSGAAVPNASITATQIETGSFYTKTSGGTGYYRFPELELGTYTIRVEAAGFKVQQESVLIQLNTTASLNVTLSAGSVSETVVVLGDAPTLETESSEIGTSVTPEQVTGLPLIVGGQGGLGSMRSPQAFAFLAPGAVGPGSGGTEGGPFVSSIGGGQAYDEEIMLDGADVLNSENGTIVDDSLPSVEGFLEFKVTTSNTSAEYGRNAGDVESFTTKSGTNNWHGNVYTIIRNTDLDANSWFNNGYAAQNPAAASAYVRSPDKLEDYGLTLGGPVWLPKLYKGTDKLFFFFSWEQFRQNAGGTTVSTLPTTAERTGDFSGLLGSTLTPLGTQTNPCDSNNPIYVGEIFDPTTTATVGGTTCRAPFRYNGVLNTINPARLDAVVQKVLGFVPATNLGAPGVLANNYSFQGSNPQTDTTDTIRIDYNLSQKDKIYGMYAARENLNDSNTPTLPQPVDGTNVQDHFSRYFRAGWDHIFSSALLNHLNVGYNRVQSPQVAISGTTGHKWPTELGINGVLPGVIFPNFNNSEGAAFGATIDRHLADNGYRFNDSLNWQRGRHSFLVGADWRFQRWNANSNTDNSGVFNYNRNETAPEPNETAQTGNGWASLYIGATDEALAIVPAHQPDWKSHYLGFFVQDDYKVSAELTVNLGFRWDEDTPRREKLNDSSIMSLTLANPGAGNLPGAYQFASNCSGCNPTWANTWHKNFAPRLGFAYAPKFLRGKTTLRGAYGVFYTALQYSDGGTGMQQGYAANPLFQNSDKFTPAIYLQNGFPAYAPPPDLDPAIANNASPDYIAPSFGRPGMVQSWNVQIQHELATDLIASVGYVGHHATHTRSNLLYLNNLPDSEMALGNGLSATPTTLPYPGFSGNVSQTLLPFPQYQSINTWEYLENEGQNSYNSLQAQLQRRFRNGLNLLASYTFAKTLSDADALLPTFGTYAGGGGIQDPHNLKGEKSVGLQDLPNAFVVSYMYELPVGKGHRFLNQGGLTDKLVGGFHVGGVQRYQSGQPLVIGCASGIPGMSTCIRYDQVSGQSLASTAKQGGHFNPFSSVQANQLYLNINAFQDPNTVANGANVGGTAPYVFGNLPRQVGAVRTADYYEEDLTAGKEIPIYERLKFDLRAEFNNAFNRHVFGAPNSSPSSPGFGTVTGLDDQPRKIQFHGQFTF